MMLSFSVVVCVLASANAFAPSPSFGAARSSNLKMSSSEGGFDFDIAIIGCGVGGHGAALHSRSQSLKTAVFAGGDVGGTCVNRGCVPSKALLAASGRVRDMKDASHLESMGITVEGGVKYDRQGIADHAKNLANKVKGNLEGSLVGLGVDVIEGRGVLTGKPNEVKDALTGKIYTAKVGNKRRKPNVIRNHFQNHSRTKRIFVTVRTGQFCTCYVYRCRHSHGMYIFVSFPQYDTTGYYLGTWFHPICASWCHCR